MSSLKARPRHRGPKVAVRHKRKLGPLQIPDIRRLGAKVRNVPGSRGPLSLVDSPLTPRTGARHAVKNLLHRISLIVIVARIR